MSEERKKILEMVASGKITAAEGERLLEALESRAPGRETKEEATEAAASVMGKIGEAIRDAVSCAEGAFPNPLEAILGRGGRMRGEPVEGAEDGVELPPQAIVQLNTTAGDLSVRGGRGGGKMVVHSDAEGVEVSREEDRFYVAAMAGDLHVDLPTVRQLIVEHTGGDVEVTGCSGHLRARLLGGDAEIEGEVTSLDIDCKGGDLELRGLALLEGEHRIKHLGGDTEISFAPQASVRVQVSSMGGDVEADVEPRKSSAGLVRKTHTFCYGDGAATLTVSSMGGDVVVCGPATAPAAEE